MSHVYKLKIKLAKDRRADLIINMTIRPCMQLRERENNWVSALEHGGFVRNLRNQTENEMKALKDLTWLIKPS